MHESTCPPARLPLFFGLYLVEGLVWSAGASRMPDDPPGAQADTSPPAAAGR